MSDDRTWMQRAFPTLSPEEADCVANSLSEKDSSDLPYIMEVATKLRSEGRYDRPPREDETELEAFERRFVLGSEPLPDLATAEEVRTDLQQKLACWVLYIARTQSIVVEDLRAKASRKLEPNRWRYLLWHLAQNDISKEGINSELSKRLGAEDMKQIRKDFKIPEEKNKRTKRVRQTIKDMRHDLKKGKLPYNLAPNEVEEIDVVLSFEYYSE